MKIDCDVSVSDAMVLKKKFIFFFKITNSINYNFSVLVSILVLSIVSYKQNNDWVSFGYIN